MSLDQSLASLAAPFDPAAQAAGWDGALDDFLLDFNFNDGSSYQPSVADPYPLPDVSPAPSYAGTLSDPLLDYVPGCYPHDQVELMEAYVAHEYSGSMLLSRQSPTFYADARFPESVSSDTLGLLPTHHDQQNSLAYIAPALVSHPPPVVPVVEDTPSPSPAPELELEPTAGPVQEFESHFILEPLSGLGTLPAIPARMFELFSPALSPSSSTFTSPSGSTFTFPSGSSCTSPSLPPPTPYDSSPSPLMLTADSDGEDGNDIEYVPSSVRSKTTGKARAIPPTAPSKRASKGRTRAVPYPAFVFETTSSPAPASTTTTADGLVVYQRRNPQVALPPSVPAPSADDPRPAWMEDAFPQCPFCPLKAARMPDFERHVKTHLGNTGRWVCCGVPVEFAAQYGVAVALPSACDLLAVKREEAEAEDAGAGAEAANEKASVQGQLFLYNGQWMVGGCHNSVSRRDALMRHLRKGGGKCVGDAYGPWLVGNQEEPEKAAKARERAMRKANAEAEGPGPAKGKAKGR